MANGPSTTETRHLRTLFAVGAAGCLTDGQLLERFATRSGDPSELAFAALVERHGSMVLRVARATLGNEHSAHDAFQATFLILARKARSLWVRDSLGPWLHAVAFRVASHSRAAEVRRRHHERGASGPEAFDSREWAQDDLARVIHEEIERLPQPYRLAIVTCHLEGLTQHEAAHRLGWPVGTVQSRLARGRQRLRDQLERRGLAPSIGVLAARLAPVPHTLMVSTAKAASTLNLGGAIAGMIPSTVLAMIGTTTKGMLMTKLKFGAVALVMGFGIIGSGIGLGVGRDARATDGQAPAGKVETSPVDPAPSPTPALAESIPPPTDIGMMPILLNFHAYKKGGAGLAMKPVIDAMVQKGYLVKSIDIDELPAWRDRFKVTVLPTYIIVNSTGEVWARREGVMPAKQLVDLCNMGVVLLGAPGSTVMSAKQLADLRDPNPPPQPGPWPAPAREDVKASEPSLSTLPPPRPWETAVRIKWHFSEKERGFGSGTIIQSSAEESIILTCGHNFRIKGSPQPSPKNFPGPISVDLFDGKLTGRQPAMVGRSEQDIPAEVIDYDLREDVGLIRIRPGRQLPASPVIPPAWPFAKGMKMVSLGCSHGADATAWDTTILDLWVPMKDIQQGVATATIKCSHRPKEGRSGGGLFTVEGYVAGVCSISDPDEQAGYYACPGAIHRLLDRNGLTSLYLKKTAAGLQAAPEVDVDIHGFKDPAPPDLLNRAGRQPSSPAATEPAADRRVSDQDRRLNDLEQKLDRVLKALEDLKGDKTPDGPVGDFPRKR